MSNDKEELLLKQVREIVDKLQSLANANGGQFYYALSCITLNTTRAIITQHNRYVSEFNSSLFGLILDDYTAYYDYLATLEQSFIVNGDIVVTCVNDQKQPTNFKVKLIKNYMYIVERIIIGKNGNLLYQLRNSHGSNKFGFDARRFEVLVHRSKYS